MFAFKIFGYNTRIKDPNDCFFRVFNILHRNIMPQKHMTPPAPRFTTHKANVLKTVLRWWFIYIQDYCMHVTKATNKNYFKKAEQ